MTLIGLPPEALALAIAAALAAAFVRGLAGFGKMIKILLVPVLSLAIPPREAVVVGNLLGLFIGTDRLAQDYRPCRTFGLDHRRASDGGNAAGRTRADSHRAGAGAAADRAGSNCRIPDRAPAQARRRARAEVAETGLTGITSGLLTGFAGMPGPPVVPYYLRRVLSAQIARASMMAIFLATSQKRGACRRWCWG